MRFLDKIAFLCIIYAINLNLEGNLFAQDSLQFKSVFRSSLLLKQEGSSLPFWMYTNTSAELNPESTYNINLESNLTLKDERSVSTVQMRLFMTDGMQPILKRGTLFISHKREFWQAQLGAKPFETLHFGLATTANNFLESNNARPFPGLRLEANKPFPVFKNFGIDWGIAHYQLNDARFVDKTRVHYKRFGIVWQQARSTFKANLSHYVQWAGVSQSEGQLPQNFRAFLDVFWGRSSSQPTNANDTINLLGNHLGLYQIEWHYNANTFKFVLYHQHPFEDGSGNRFGNRPDGTWGVGFTPRESSFWKYLVYEFVHTFNQSKGSSSGRDNYFNNSIYASGWTYDGNIIGLPFFTAHPQASGAIRISNRVQVHHLGLMASTSNWTFKYKSSYVNGTLNGLDGSNYTHWYHLLQTQFTDTKWGQIAASIGYDFLDNASNRIAGQLTYHLEF